MSFPFTIMVCRPSRAEVRALFRNARFWLLTVLIMGAVTGTLLWTRPWVRPQLAPVATVDVSSSPAGVAVSVDGQARGQTPLVAAVTPGMHEVLLHRNGYADLTYRLVLAPGERHRLHAVLWQQHPTIEQLGTILPGAQILDAGFLADGRVIVTLGFASGDERQAWILDRNALPHRIGPPEARGAISVTADGRTIAYLSSSDTQIDGLGRLDQVRVTRKVGAPGTPVYRAPTAAEHLVDLSWAPDGQRLLITSEESRPAGGSRTHLRLDDLAGAGVRDLVTLPSGVVPGSDTWDPTGTQVAFLARVGDSRALCVLDTRDGAVRVLADLGASTQSPFPPLDWSSDGRSLLYNVPVSGAPTLGGFLFGSCRDPFLFVADASDPLGRRLGDATGQFPVWRDDGSILTLTQPASSGPLTLRSIDPDGQRHDLGALPIRSGAGFGVRWDVRHGQALLAIPDPNSFDAGNVSYWLLRFASGADR